jgi:hypothetical protein
MMWFSFILGLMILLIPLAYLLASLAGLSYLWYRVFKGRLSRGGSDLPTCARCGYAVRGLMGLDCPECGADLREVGIVTPKQRGAVSPVMFVLLWTLLLPGPSCLLSGLLVAVGPKASTSGGMLNLAPIASGQYVSADINYTNFFMLGAASYTGLTIEGNNTQYESLDIDPVAMTYEDWSGTVRTSPSGTATSTRISTNSPGVTKPLDRQAILDLLKRAGADITRQDVMDEADELLSIIQGIPTQGLGNLSPTYFTQSYFSTGLDQPAGWFMGLLLGLWLIVWIMGFWLYFRLRRKRKPTQTDSPEPTSPSLPTD